MNATLFADNELPFWSINVVLQVTVITAVALSVAASVRRRPVLRCGLLTATLILLLTVPGVAVLGPMSGIALLSVDTVDGHGDSDPAVTTLVPVSPGYPVEPDLPVPATISPDVGQRVIEPLIPTPIEGRDLVGPDPVAANELPLETVAQETVDPWTAEPLVRMWWWSSVGMAVWAAGAFSALLWLGLQLIRLYALLRRTVKCIDSPADLCLEEICSQLSVSAPPELLQSSEVSSPVTAGLIRPRIVLPDRLINRISTEELHLILLHEMAHVVRRDPLTLLLQHVAACLYWFHPLVWLLNRGLARAREEVCDNFALGRTEAHAYGRALLHLAELLQADGPRPGVVSLMNSRWRLETRIAGLLDSRRSNATTLGRTGRTAVAVLCVALAVLGLGVSIRPAEAEGETESDQTVKAVNGPSQSTEDLDQERPQAKQSQVPATQATPRPDIAEVEQAKQLFRRSRGNREDRLRALKVLYPLVTPGATRTDVLNLFGPPDRFVPRQNQSRIVNYLIGDGERIEIEFDRDRQVVVKKRAIGIDLDPPEQPVLPIPENERVWIADYRVDAENESDRTVLRAGFVPYKPELVWGEPLTVTMTVANIGKADFNFMFGGDYRGTGRHDRIRIAVTDSDGNELADPKANSPDLGGIASVELITPRGAAFTRVVELQKFRTFNGPGRYTVQCRFAFDEPYTNTDSPRKPVIQTTFPLTILERTPERVGSVLDELQVTVADSQGQQLSDALAAMARFGREDAVPRLEHYAKFGTLPQRTAAIAALPIASTDSALNVVLAQLTDRRSEIRIAAATALGQMPQTRSIEALLRAFEDREPEVQSAVLVALGTSKSELGLPVFSRILDHGPAELKPAAVTGLVRLGGPTASEILLRYVESPDPAFRFRVVDALASDLRYPLNPDWLIPILMTRRHNNREWLGSLNLVRLWGGEKAVPALLSCVDFEIAWSHRNFWILHNVKYAKGGPEFDYIYDPNSRGSAEAHEKNQQTLRRLRTFAGPIPEPAVWPSPPVPELKTDPPIDFTVSLSTKKGKGEQPATVTCGFFRKTWTRTGGSQSLQPTNEWRTTYEMANRVRAILKTPESQAESGLTNEQLRSLGELSFPGNYPNVEESLSLLYMWWQESPDGPVRARAADRIRNSVRAAVQKLHTDHVTFAAAALKIMEPVQQRAARRQQADVPQFGIQRVEPTMLKSRRWLELKARLDSSPVKFRWVELSASGVCNLSLNSTPTTDLSHLKGSQIDYLELGNTRVRDLSPLNGMPLKVLRLRGCPVTSLEPLRGTPLIDIDLSLTKVHDLSPLSAAELKTLVAVAAPLADLSPLAGMPLEYVDLRNTAVSDLAPLVNDQLWSLQLESSPVTDLSPLKKAPLKTLWLGNMDGLDLSQLQGLKLTTLTLQGRQFDDISDLAGLPIEKLWLNNTNVRDLAAVRDMPLKELTLTETPVTDLTPIRGMKLTTLFASEPGVDFAPVADMPLERVGIRHVAEAKNIEVLRNIPTLRTIQSGGKPLPVDDYWKRFDAGEFQRP